MVFPSRNQVELASHAVVNQDSRIRPELANPTSLFRLMLCRPWITEGGATMGGMKFGMRTPSLTRSIKARTTGRAKRAIKRALIPGYGRKGMGYLKNPKRAAKNSVYKRTTFSLWDMFK
ncbi:hypothetical protein HMPREF3198_02072 [Winkia neuii]|nr:hypothetical protein HMPREF3198_02072 [Winkia neuii]